jgi:hypothetical protein
MRPRHFDRNSRRVSMLARALECNLDFSIQLACSQRFG